MATRKIVPRADNEGGIGTALKRWASAFITAITATTINALTLAAQTVGFTIAGGTTSKTLTISDTMTLALGAANLKRFMNSAGTDQEWAKGIKLITTTRDLAASGGSVPYTGAGFKPSLIIVLAAVGVTGGWSVGLFDGSTYGNLSENADTPPVTILNTSKVFTLSLPAGYQNATVSSFDSDGVTLSYDKAGSPTGTVNIAMLFFR